MIKRLIALLLMAGLATIFAGLLVGYVPDRSLNLTAEYYAARTAVDLGAQNVVTAIIVTYRGLDTLGEVTVLFLTAAIVAMVLSQTRQPDDGTPVPPVGELLDTGSQLLTPLILLFGAYVFVNGHLTPGGGFQGGAILASGILLLLLVKPTRRLSHAVISVIESTSGLLYVGIGIAGVVLAGGFLDNRILPLGEFGTLFSGGAIPLIYTLIGLKVGAEFSSMMVSLSETVPDEEERG